MKNGDKIEQIKRQKYFVRGDIAVFSVLLVIIMLFFAVALFVPKPDGEGFTVYYRGERIFSASLSEDAEYVFRIENGNAKVERYEAGTEYSDYNRIRVSNGGVSVTESDCPDHTCENFGERRWGEIVCVPHGLRIEISGNGLETDV